MDEARFSAILEAYGADPRRWPEAERAAAEALAATRPELLRQARALDALLDLDTPTTSDLLIARVLKGRRLHAPVTWRPFAALAASALLGLALGGSREWKMRLVSELRARNTLVAA